MDKKKLLTWYIQNRNYFNKGLGEINSLRQIIQVSAIVGSALKIFGISTIYSIYVVVGLSVFGVIGCWTLGFLWDRYKAYNIEHSWNNERNPFCKIVEEKLK